MVGNRLEKRGGPDTLYLSLVQACTSMAPNERSAIIGGVDGASCILGAKLADIEPKGTVPHRYINSEIPWGC